MWYYVSSSFSPPYPFFPFVFLNQYSWELIFPTHILGNAGFQRKKPFFLALPTKLFYNLTSAYFPPFLSPQNLPLAILHYLPGLEHANGFGSSLPSSVLFSLSECFLALIHEHQLNLCYRLKCVM